MEQAMVLMTTHGTLLCRDGEGGLYHLPLEAVGPADMPLLVDLHAVTRAGRHERMLTLANTPLALVNLPGLPSDCELVIAGDRRTASLRQSGLYFSVEPMNRPLAHDRHSAGSWETFLFVTNEDFASLRHLFSNHWIIGSTRQIVEPAAIRFDENFRLVLGPLVLDLRYQLPLLPHAQGAERSPADAFAYTILIDGWKIERIYKYKPLIYLTAFGSPDILDRAFSAIRSLVEFGRYTGRIHVITDRDKQLYLDSVPGVAPEQLSVQRIVPQDNVGYLAAKLSILDYEPAHEFQPVFFIDSDVVCDAPLEPMLTTVVTLERMSAPLEETTSLRTNPSVGATLIQRAGLAPRWACGLNTGTIGMPNLYACAEHLELMRTILTNHTDIFGREQFTWGDQEVINYVSYQSAHFDTQALLRFVRYGWQGDEFDGTRRLGLVHFWPGIEGRPKQDRMRDYLETLRATGGR